ncbi:MAG: FKBP-type peptidyl-prolyl cis-trans isomerase [Dysgonamonadaceae bacterium]|jgi:FKBP-type peptidyl-prolyl cis-trans isomerase|nr:FKBP-type peptidyl-prolyl cis-trans isomerase [Dysgonamonadaceae bacterium]
MKQLFKILYIICLLLPFTACNNNDEADEAWKNSNQDAYRKVQNDPSYTALETASGPSGVYYKVIDGKTGDETNYPLHTASVKILYKGYYYDDAANLFDEGTGSSNTAKELYLQNTVRGFNFALQNMSLGAKWKIVIPYYLGYGETNLYDDYYNVTMKGCTTLFFEVELVEINQYPKQ